MLQQTKPLKFVPTWPESVVGVVTSGYVRDSAWQHHFQWFEGYSGTHICVWQGYMEEVDTDTEFYQVFVKDAKYDKRHLIVIVNPSETEYGTPTIVDGTASVVENRNLQFWDEK